MPKMSKNLKIVILIITKRAYFIVVYLFYRLGESPTDSKVKGVIMTMSSLPTRYLALYDDGSFVINLISKERENMFGDYCKIYYSAYNLPLIYAGQ